MGWVRPVATESLADHVSLGLVTAVFPPGLVDRVVDGLGRREARSRLLPARTTVYFTLGLALHMGDSYEDVMRLLVAGLEWGSGWKRRWRVPTSGALAQARARLGPEVLKGLFEEVAEPLEAGGRVGGLDVVAMDSTVLDVADTPGNVGAFGLPARDAAYPQVRVLAFAHCASRAIFAADVAGCRTGEAEMAEGLFGRLGEGTLLLADRGFYCPRLWWAARRTGADLCWRVKNGSDFPVVQELGDGSYLSKVYANADARRKDAGGTPARVVPYAVKPDAGGAGERYTLLTTILDPGQASAQDLAGAYRERWWIEQSFDELKTHQRGQRVVLRSKSPPLVRQEVWALLCVHFAIRSLMALAAEASGLDPGRLGFVAALKAVRRSVAELPGFSPQSPG